MFSGPKTIKQIFGTVTMFRRQTTTMQDILDGIYELYIKYPVSKNII